MTGADLPTRTAAGRRCVSNPVIPGLRSGWGWWVFAGVVVAGTVTAHLLLASRSAQYTGVLLVLDHAYSQLVVLALCAVGAGLGGRLVKAGGPRLDAPLETLLFWMAAGHAALVTAILGVGLLVSVRPLALLALFAGAAWLGRNELRELPWLVAGAFRGVRDGADRLSLWLFFAVVLFLVTRALAPPTDWDALMYHLRVPDQFLGRSSIYRPEDNGHVAFVGLPHMLYLPLLALGSSAGPAVLNAWYTLGLALAGFALARRFLDGRTAGVHLAALWGSTVVVLVAITPRTDTILAFYLFLVHYAVMLAHGSGERRFLFLSAALGGAAFGIKYTALLYLVALAPLVAWVVGARLDRRAAAAAGLGGVVLLAALPWLLKNALLLGDPVYPFLSGPEPEPWLARLYGSAAWPSHLDPAALEQLWRAQAPFNLVDLFTAPERITVELEGALYRPNPLLLLLPLWTLCWRSRALAWLGLPALGYAALVVAMQPSTSIRYLIPAIAPLTLVALHAFAAGLDRLLSAKAVRAVLAAATLFGLIQTASVVSVHLTSGRQVAHLLGFTSRQDFVKAWTGEYADAVAFVNERLPRESRVLMLFEARGYYFRVPVVQDNGIVNWPMLSAKATAPDCLRSVGITHVLINQGALGYYRRKGVAVNALRWDALQPFAEACLVPIYSAGGIAVFRIRDP